MTRIPPRGAPYDPETRAVLERMMPARMPPIALFRTFAHNLSMTDAMHGWGSYEHDGCRSSAARGRCCLASPVSRPELLTGCTQ